MVAYRRLKSAPIVEAVIDFRVRLRAPIDASTFMNVSSEFKATFPKAGLMRQRAVEISFDPGTPNGLPSETMQGVRFDSELADKAAIFTLEGFTFSHLKNYSDWSSLKADAMKAWTEYLELAEVVEIVRVGVRYINRIELPSSVEFNDFFTAAPSMPPELPQVIGPFLSRVFFPLPNSLGIGSLTHVHSASMGEGTSVILDIDIYQENTNYDPRNGSVWDLLDKLRDQKNNVFFASVTEKTLEKYL